MKIQLKITAIVLLAGAVVFNGCAGSGGDDGSGSTTYTVIYDGNGATGGTAPVDTTNYETGMTVIVKGNTDGFEKTGFAFAGWNTRADENGITYSGGQTFAMGDTDVTLYATWAASGTLDTSFDPETGADSSIYSIAIQSDGKILIGGDFSSYNGTERSCIARLNADGTLDTSFSPGTGADSHIASIAIQSDGKILIGGDFSSYNGTERNHIARLNADGTLDTLFNPGSGANYSIYSIAIQGDGKILIGGPFTFYNGTPRRRIARLNADGTLDTSFDPIIGANNAIYSIAIKSDGKIIIGGLFSSYNETARNRIARLNADGMLDTSFDPGTGANGDVYSIAIKSDGKIIIGGLFSSYNETARNCIARLNADGTLDTSFNPGAGIDIGVIGSMAVQGDGKILIAGDFLSYNGTERNRIARIWN